MKKVLFFFGRLIVYIVAVSFIITATMYIIRGGYIPKLKFGYAGVYLFVCVSSILYFKITPWLKDIKAFLSLFIPFVLLTIYGLMVNKDLYPVIFPVLTVIAFIGVLLGYSFHYMGKRQALIIFSSGSILIFLWNTFFLDNILYKDTNDIYSSAEVKINYSDHSVLDTSENKLLLRTLSANKVTLLDFTYDSCKPCREKLPFLNDLQKELKDSFKVLIIVNGAIDNYQSYKRIVAENENLEFLEFYYDPQGVFTKSLKIKSFPTEFLVDKNQFVRLISVGFQPDLENTYVQDRKKNILNIQ